jgi:hypothetical protein
MILALLFGVAGTSACADPITIPGYTVTDLGSAAPSFSTDASGNGVLNAGNGQIFAFSQTPNTTVIPANVPLPASPSAGPWSYATVFNYLQNGVMNASGMVTGVDISGVGDKYYSQTVFAVQYNPNGTWGQPITLYQGLTEPGAMGVERTVSVVGLSKMNEVLIGDRTPDSLSTDGAYVYNMNTGKLTDLQFFFPKVSYLDPNALAIDDDGRILLSATSSFNITASGDLTYLLLTPDGLSAAPLEVAAPEASTLAVMVVAIAAFAAHRGFRCRRRLEFTDK